MRLLHIICSTDAESGGPIEALKRISEVHLRDGHTIEAVSLEAPEEAAARQFDFPLIGVGRGVGKYRFASSLTPWVKKNAANYDAVVLHGLWNYSSVGAWRALRKLQTPYFIFAHGMMDPWFREQYPLKHFAKQIYWSLLEGRVLRRAASVLFTCREEMERARNVFRGHSYRGRVVLFGTADPGGDAATTIAEFAAAFPELKNRRFLLFLSRIHPKKGCDLLIRAFAACISTIPADLDFIIAGPDQVGWVPTLKSLAGKLGVADRIHWPGMLTGNLKWGAFRSAEAMILPSHTENFGFVVAEAMACSTPVLISDKVNIWREVEAAGGGFVEPDTEEGTKNLIRKFVALPPEEHARMRSNAREGFLRHFDIEVSARDFARMVESVRSQAVDPCKASSTSALNRSPQDLS
jgi:glycosyltransferase involved in cell wall biosynthesis